MANYFDWVLQRPGLHHLAIEIFEYLDIESVAKCLQVSEKWYQFMKAIKSLWKEQLLKTFPLNNACAYGHIGMVKLLIEYGFDVNAGNEVRNTPLYYILHHNLFSTKAILEF